MPPRAGEGGCPARPPDSGGAALPRAGIRAGAGSLRLPAGGSPERGRDPAVGAQPAGKGRRMESAGARRASGGSRDPEVVCEKHLFKGNLPEPLFQLACSHQHCAFPVRRNELCVWNTATAQVKPE